MIAWWAVGLFVLGAVAVTALAALHEHRDWQENRDEYEKHGISRW